MGDLAPGGEALIIAALAAGAYVSLHTSDPGTTGANEVAGNAYTREALGTVDQSGSNPTTGVNHADVTFPTATGLWGSITYWGLWSAASGGIFYGGKAVTTAKTIDVGDVARFPAGSLSLTGD